MPQGSLAFQNEKTPNFFVYWPDAGTIIYNILPQKPRLMSLLQGMDEIQVFIFAKGKVQAAIKKKTTSWSAI